jgi:hypothetical protein
MNPSNEPKLAAPGAGLPKVELMIGRLLFARQRLTGDAAAFNAHLQTQRVAIRALIERTSPEARAKRVLIERPRGLEDSSRYWSVWMTLEHLRMVNVLVAGIIEDLLRGRTPAGVVSTATVKPRPDVNGEVERLYEKSCDVLIALSEGAELKTRLRYAHPWFGKLDGSGWHALVAGHVGLHRVQVERIVAGLPNS